MTMNQMYYYVAVCERKSFSKAAEEIYVSQPTLSKQIAALETELGVQLIMRKTRGLFELTTAGTEYLNSFRQILRDFEEINRRARGEDAPRRVYKIGIMENWFFQDLIRVCRQKAAERFPNVDLEFYFLSMSRITELRSAGDLDLALLQDDINWPMEQYCWQKLRDLDGVLYVSSGNRHIRDNELNIRDLKDETLYAPDRELVLNAEAHPVFHMMERSELKICHLPNLTSIHMNVLSGDGYSFADEWSAVVFDPAFHAKRLPQLRRGILLSWKAEDHSELTEMLKDSIRSWMEAPVF